MWLGTRCLPRVRALNPRSDTTGLNHTEARVEGFVARLEPFRDGGKLS